MKKSDSAAKPRRGVFLIKAVLLTPLLMVPLAALLQSLWFLADPPESWSDLSRLYVGGAIAAMATLIYAYGFVLFYGLPVYLWLCRRGQDSLRNMIIIGSIPGLALSGLLHRQASWLFYAGIIFYGVVLSAGFWWIMDLCEKIARADTDRKMDR